MSNFQNDILNVWPLRYHAKDEVLNLGQNVFYPEVPEACEILNFQSPLYRKCIPVKVAMSLRGTMTILIVVGYPSKSTMKRVWISENVFYYI